MLNKSALMATLVMTVALASTGCTSRDQAAKAASAPPANPLKVHVNDELLRSITIGQAQVKDVTTQEKVAARIETDAARMARIGSPVDGRITKVLVYEGQK